MGGEKAKSLLFLVHQKSNDTFLFLDHATTTSLLNFNYLPMFDPWDNFAAGRYFYQLFFNTSVQDDDAYIKMIQDIEFREILGIINEAKILVSSQFQKVFLLDFQAIPHIKGTLSLNLKDVKIHKYFQQDTLLLINNYLISQIHLDIEPIYICQLNPSPYSDGLLKNVEEALHRGYHQEQNEVWITYRVAFNEFPTAEELLKFSSVIINGSCSSVNDTSLSWIEQLKDTIRLITSMKLRLYGVCFGHQVIAHTLGGRVELIKKFKYNLRGRVHLNQSLRFEDVMYENLNVYFAHGEEVVQVPDDTVPIFSANHCDIVGYQGESILGMQFHPEYNVQILKFLAMKDKLDDDKTKMFQEIDQTLNPDDDDSYSIQKITRAYLKQGKKLLINSGTPLTAASSVKSSYDSLLFLL